MLAVALSDCPTDWVIGSLKTRARPLEVRAILLLRASTWNRTGV